MGGECGIYMVMANQFILFLVIVVLAGLIIWRERQARIERKDLIDRIMSMDFQVYKRAERGGGETATKHFMPTRMTDAQMAAAAELKDRSAAIGAQP